MMEFQVCIVPISVSSPVSNSLHYLLKFSCYCFYCLWYFDICWHPSSLLDMDSWLSSSGSLTAKMLLHHWDCLHIPHELKWFCILSWIHLCSHAWHPVLWIFFPYFAVVQRFLYFIMQLTVFIFSLKLLCDWGPPVNFFTSPTKFITLSCLYAAFSFLFSPLVFYGLCIDLSLVCTS